MYISEECYFGTYTHVMYQHANQVTYTCIKHCGS